MKIDDKGFSLIEVMIATAILAIGLLGLAGMQGTAIKGNAYGNSVMEATTLAQETIEQIRNSDYDNINTTNFPAFESNVDGSIYDRSTQIEDNQPLNELKRITVTISWRKVGLLKNVVVLRTIVSNED